MEYKVITGNLLHGEWGVVRLIEKNLQIGWELSGNLTHVPEGYDEAGKYKKNFYIQAMIRKGGRSH